jgi:DNA-binding transcriptional LysR family regulator
MALTEDGALYYAKVQRIVTDVELAHRAISHSDSELQGRLSIASTAALAPCRCPAGRGFCHALSAPDPELNITDNKISHIHSGIDLSLRIKPHRKTGSLPAKSSRCLLLSAPHRLTLSVRAGQIP